MNLLASLLLLPGLTGCARESWRNADLQLDITTPLPELAEQVRVCASGGPARTIGAGPDSYALPGLVAVGPVDVTVDLIHGRTEDTGQVVPRVIARAQGVRLALEAPWQEAALQIFASTQADLSYCEDCPLACDEEGPGAGAEEESWLLAVRFQS